MHTTTAITLVLLGGGATAMAVHTAKRCEDPSTGQPIACSSTYGGYSGSHYYYGGSYHSSSGTGTASVARGGFGGFGSMFHGRS